MTIVLGAGGQPLTSSSTTHRAQRTGGGAVGGAGGNISSNTRFGGTRYRRVANSIAGAGSSTLGGQPLAAADPNSTKKDIKHRFEISGKLGSGTYGKVSLAFDHKTEREVAVKLIKKSAIENKQDLVRIRREIRIMSMLNHPNIVQIYEVFENKDKIILVMEYANGGELYDHVSKNGSLAEPEARRIFRQITSAVLYCHKNKVAHRDLKLENILLDASNNAKIADFGLSNYFGLKSKPLLNTFCGSPLYASPEIINGTPYKGPEVDCWSLGILLYTLVYGSMPFDGRDFNRMVRQIKRGAYYEPDTPSTASMLIRNMLRVNPERRATIYDIASHWWLNLEENMPVIQELPENQITDPTPLTERAEIMVVQELGDETDVFMEFGHLSHATRRKIEEFRRRRKEAEEYNENSPIKPPKARKEDGGGEGGATLQPGEELSSGEKSLRAVPEKKAKKAEPEGKSVFHDPLERLRQLENRLQGGVGISNTPANAKRGSPAPEEPEMRKEKERKREKGSSSGAKGSEGGEAAATAPEGQEQMEQQQQMEEQQPMVVGGGGKKGLRASESKKALLLLKKQESVEAAAAPAKKLREQSLIAATTKRRESLTTGGSNSVKKSSVVKPDEKQEAPQPPLPPSSVGVGRRRAEDPTQYWRLETDSLNALMNQVLEQMERGPVSINLIARIRVHPFYDERPEVKELLESIISAQPAAVQQQASKLIQQQSMEIGLRQVSSKAITRKAGGSVKKRTTTVDLVRKASIGAAAGKEKAGKAAAAAAMLMVKENKKQQEEESKTMVEEEKGIKDIVEPTPVEVRKAQFRRKAVPERRWHSVEVGFSTDSSTEESQQPADGGTGPHESQQPCSPNKKTTDAIVAQHPVPIALPPQMAAPRFVGATRVTRSEPYESFDEEEEELEDEYYDAEEEEEEEFEEEIDELAEEVEQVTGGDSNENIQKGEEAEEKKELLKARGKTAAAGEEVNNNKKAPNKPCAPRIVETTAPDLIAPLSPTRGLLPNGQHLSTLERGLAKRVSKGKYQFMAHQLVEMYGRGVSAEADSPPATKRRIGGPQPRAEHSPILFDKAKDYIMRYPEEVGNKEEEAAATENLLIRRQKGNNNKTGTATTTLTAAKASRKADSVDGGSGGGKSWLKSQDPDVSAENSSSSAIVVPPPPGDDDNEAEAEKKGGGKAKMRKNQEKEIAGANNKNEDNDQEDDEEEEKEEEEEEEEEDTSFRPRPSTIIGFRTIQPAGNDGVRKEAPIVQVKPQTSQPQSPVTTKAGTPQQKAQLPYPESPLAKSPPRHLNQHQHWHHDAERSTSPPVFASSPTKKTTSQSPEWNSGGAPRQYESAAAYIRRKNRERRARNATVAVTDDAWTRFSTSIDRPGSPPTAAARRKGSTSSTTSKEQPFDADGGDVLNGGGGTAHGGMRRHGIGGGEERAGAVGGGGGSNYSRQTYLDRRKSFHEMSPPSYDEQQQVPYDRYAIAGGYFNSLVGNSHMPTNISRYEEEVYNAFKHFGDRGSAAGANSSWQQTGAANSGGWNSGASSGGGGREQRERFEVYKTMAERASEFGRNDVSKYQHRMASGGSCYYPGERPLSSYTGGGISLLRAPRILDDQAQQQYGSTTATGGQYGAGRRSFYEPAMERPVTPGSDYGNVPATGGGYYSSHHHQQQQTTMPEPDSPPTGANRFRRRFAALRDADGRRAHAARSQSNDHLFLLYGGGGGDGGGGVRAGGYGMPPDDLEPIEPMNGSSRYTTPEIGMSGGYMPQVPLVPDYAYVAYHDTGMGGGQLPHHRRPMDHQHELGGGGGAGVRGILKNRQTCEFEPRSAGTGPTAAAMAYVPQYDWEPTGGGGGAAAAIAGRKKRGSGGLLDMARRKTTEVRLGPEKHGTNALLEEEYKRPRSPIEAIKSLFRGGAGANSTQKSKDGSNNPMASMNGHAPVSSNYTSSRFSTAIGTGGGMSSYGGVGVGGYGAGGGAGAGGYKRYGGGAAGGIGGTTNAVGAAYTSSRYGGAGAVAAGGYSGSSAYSTGRGAGGGTRPWAYEPDSHL